MKRMILTLVTMLAAALTAQAMTYTEARREALFLTDKMAYELGLIERKYDAAYEINLDYLMSLSSEGDLYSSGWYRRNTDLKYVLTTAQYNKYLRLNYFYRPVYWSGGFCHRIYTRYSNRSLFYYSRPASYSTYRGGHSWSSNGGRSWYKGRKFASGPKMKSGMVGTGFHSKSRQPAKKPTGHASTVKRSGHSTVKTTPKSPSHGTPKRSTGGRFNGKR